MPNVYRHKEENVEEKIRLNKFLSEAGICSRRKADEYIAAGKVTVDGEIAQTGMKVLKNQKIEIEGVTAKKEEEFILLAFYKPKGIVCTTSKKDKDNIIDFIHYPKRIFPVGRLDKDSEGLLLLTNDGEFMNYILKARHFHEKEYVVRVDREITPQFIRRMSKGVPILDTVTRECKVWKTGKQEFHIVLTQGLNRQIRRMCEAVGYQVRDLKRIRIMNYRMENLKSGQYKKISQKEAKHFFDYDKKTYTQKQ